MTRLWSLAAFLLGSLAAAAASAQPASPREPLRVSGIVAQPGQQASGYITVPDGVDPGTKIPVTVIQGSKSGPVLALVAGTHGSEYTSIVALQRVRARVDATKLTGSLILVHMSNPTTFYGRRIYWSPDGKNLNRVYPGQADGTLSQRIAYAITSEVIARATFLVDMHCGDGNESLRPYSYWQVTGDPALDAAGKRLALAFGLDHIVIDRERPADPDKTLYLSNTAVRRGKPAITVESGGVGQTDEPSVQAQEAGALSVMKELGMLEAPSVRVLKPLFVDRSEVVTSPATGVWHPLVQKMQSVATGTLLGQLTDPFGNVLHELRAPFAGEVLYVVATPPVSEGEPLAFVGHLTEEEPKP
jgi:predicted deacylase